MSHLNSQNHAYDCVREHGKIYGQTLTNQSSLSQNNGIKQKKKKLKLDEEVNLQSYAKYLEQIREIQ